MTSFVHLSSLMARLTPDQATRPAGRSPRRMAGAALAAALIAVAGYAGWGAPEPAAVPETATAAPTPAKEGQPADDAIAQAESRVAAMVDSLAQRLKSQPDDAEGWQMLGRSYAALGRHSQAIDAFKTALRLRPDDATLLAEFAFSAAVLDPHAASGEPARLVTRALALDPRNAKALALAGTLALERKDYGSAVRHWELLAQREPADGAIARQLQASIRQTRQLAALQIDAAPAIALMPVSSPALPRTDRARVSGVLTLAPALMARASPEDTVFIFARAAGGPRVPLAVLRKQVKDLPLRFTLDDSLAMSPAALLSGASTVVVGARIARGGGAMAQDGDLQGQLAAVKIGSGDLKLEINEVVRLR